MEIVRFENGLVRSTDFLSKLNSFREDAGENAIRHNDFMARIADELDGEHYEIIVVQNSNKTSSNIACLNQDQAFLVGMRESRIVRRKVRDWINSQSVPQTMPEALRLAADLAEEKAALEQKVAEDAPKVEFVETYVEFGQTKCFRDVAAILGVKQSYFTNVLKASKIVYQRAGVYKAYSDYAKYFEVKVGSNTYTDKVTGLSATKDYEQLRVNNAGIVYLAKRFGNPELKSAALAIAKEA